MTNHSDLEQARALIREGQQAEAEALLKQCGDEPDCAAALRDLLLADGRREEALSVATELARGTSAESLVSASLLAFYRDDLKQALHHCQAALAKQADLPSAFHHAGRALHNTGQSNAALQSLQKAVQANPDYAEAWLSLGHVQRAIGRMDNAITSFQTAHQLAPGLATAHHDLAITLFHAEQPEQALLEFDKLLARQADHIGAQLDRGLTLMLLGQFDEARSSLKKVTERAPDNALAWLYLGQLHNELTDTERALDCLRRATELDPSDVEAWIELTGVLEQSNRESDAIEALRQGFAADPQHPGLHLEGARLERRRGDSAAAVRRLRGLDPNQLPTRLAQQYGFELGLALDREGETDAALEAFSLGNRLARQGARSSRTDANALERRCAALEVWLDKGAPGSDPDKLEGNDGADLCFLVGFPRSGTTLVDTTLATNPEVVALEEAPTLDPLIQRLESFSPPYPDALAELNAQEIQSARQSYRNNVKHLLDGAEGSLVIDKMPLRFMHAGFIQRLFPASRMVFVARHPCDVVLSNFMQQFVVNETNIHFDTLANSAQTYARIMGLWAKMEDKLSLPLLTVRYEDLVEDMAGAMTPVCGFLGLDPGSISFERDARLATRDRVRTSSYQQVAEPIYQRASGRWQRYRQHFEPLLPMLAPMMKRYGYEP